MKLTLGTTVFGRPRIETLTAAYYARLAEESRHDVELVAAVSEPEAKAAFHKAGWHTRFIENRPLGRKHNVMLSLARQTSPDYFILVGSDDWLIAAHAPQRGQAQRVVNPFDAWAEYAGAALFGPTDLHVVDLVGRRACLWSNPPQPIGAGRMFRRDVLDEAQWRLWPSHVNKGLDASMAQRLKGQRWRARGLDAGLAVIDFKTGINIWGYDAFAHRAQTETLDQALAWLPPWARELLEEQW